MLRVKAVRADSYGHKPKANVCTPASRIPHPDANVCTPASRIPMQMSVLPNSALPHPDANVCTPAFRIPYSRCKCLHSCTPASRTLNANVCTPALPNSASRYNSKYWMNNLYNKIILHNLTAASATRNGGTAASACRRPKAWQARYLHGKRTIHYLNQTLDNYVHTQNGRTRHQRKASHAHHP